MKTIPQILSAELNQPEAYIQNVIALLDEGNTIPFIARYRKEQHGAMDDTTLRTLEAAAVAPGRIQSGARDTTLFVTPGYKFNPIDALITNFHLPKSTLVMLVSAIAGRERILDAYRHAIENKYRFFSYGDAMYLENAPQAK